MLGRLPRRVPAAPPGPLVGRISYFHLHLVLFSLQKLRLLLPALVFVATPPVTGVWFFVFLLGYFSLFFLFFLIFFLLLLHSLLFNFVLIFLLAVLLFSPTLPFLSLSLLALPSNSLPHYPPPLPSAPPPYPPLPPPYPPPSFPYSLPLHPHSTDSLFIIASLCLCPLPFPALPLTAQTPTRLREAIESR